MTMIHVGGGRSGTRSETAFGLADQVPVPGSTDERRPFGERVYEGSVGTVIHPVRTEDSQVSQVTMGQKKETTSM